MTTNTDVAPEPLDDAAAVRLAEFARGCKAAARAVSLYPDGHPSVESTLRRMVEIGQRVTGDAALALTVLPDRLLLDRRAAEKPDPAITELAALLHRHQLGRFVLRDGADATTWLTFFRLLSRAPDEVREAGGIARLWGEEGGLTTPAQRASLEIQQVDYKRMLGGDGSGDRALEAIIDACLGDAPLAELDEETRATLLTIVSDPTALAAVAGELRARTGDESPAGQAAAIFGFIQNAARAVDPANPSEVDRAYGNMATVIGDLSAEAMTELLDKRKSSEATVGNVNVIGAVVGHMSDDSIADFVAGSVIAQRGATDRLAQAFQSLVPDIDSRRQLLSLAERRVAESAVGKQEDFPDVWRRTEELLTSYSDEKYVGEEYARELSDARVRAVDVEQAGDDPPDRVAGWLTTVDDTALRDLDSQLLLDLLALETDPFRWRDLADTLVTAVEELARQTRVMEAAALIDVLVAERGDPDTIESGEPSTRTFAQAALDRVATGPAMRHALAQLRSADDATSQAVGALCAALGPTVVSSLAEVLATEQDARVRRRLRDILLSFGRKGREAVQQLLSSPNWEVRQTAAFLLREFGGTEGMSELEHLLSDSEPLVQREAIRAVILIGDDRTYGALVRVLEDAKTRTRSRETLIQQLTSQRDARAVPLCAYLIRAIDHRAFTDVYLAAIETLGTIGGGDVVPPLRDALGRGEWWAPFRTRALRQAAARALRRAKSPEAVAALRDAATSGSFGVRRMARAELAGTGDRK